uniref:NAD-dependent epimerase/dehydratase family protein n=1 Tax=Desulfatirhabdium butyrativorans TaxID=340467 RepID=A0A7C4RQS1_9BACT
MLLKTALVTGANGFAASVLCRKLIERNYRVRGLVRKGADLRLLEGADVELFYGNLGGVEPLTDACTDVDVVFHLAAAYRKENVPPKTFWDVNVNGTRKVLDAAIQNGVQRFVHCSTIGVQGDIKHPPATEDHPFDPGDAYQRSKLEGELLARETFRKTGLAGAVVRPVAIYGPGDTRLLKLFRHINRGTFRMIGSGNTLYHMVHVEDLAQGFILAAEHPNAVGEVFTIGGETWTTLNELAEMIGRILGKPVSRQHIPASLVWAAAILCEAVCKPLNLPPPLYRRRVAFFLKHRAFDISKAKRLLGYAPKIPLEEGLRQTAEWYRKQGWL